MSEKVCLLQESLKQFLGERKKYLVLDKSIVSIFIDKENDWPLSFTVCCSIIAFKGTITITRHFGTKNGRIS